MRERRPLGNVLVATDFSTAATRAVERAARLPIGPGATLTVLHVLRPDPDPRIARTPSAHCATPPRLPPTLRPAPGGRPRTSFLASSKGHRSWRSSTARDMDGTS